MSGFIEVHPKNAFEGLLLVNVDDIRHVYQVSGHGKEKWAVISLQDPDTKPIDLQESYEEVKRLISQALERNTLRSMGLAPAGSVLPRPRPEARTDPLLFQPLASFRFRRARIPPGQFASPPVCVSNGAV